ncbi:hypothetical protein FXO38_02771 [Capsicum annuum]|nr:hypothetical protein FXO38_02771 [Capsicum annuum]
MDAYGKQRPTIEDKEEVVHLFQHCTWTKEVWLAVKDCIGVQFQRGTMETIQMVARKHRSTVKINLSTGTGRFIPAPTQLMNVRLGFEEFCEKSTNDFIILSHIKDKIVEVINIDSRSSAGGGVLVAVTACLNEEVSDNSETKVTTDDQVVQKSSLTSNEKEKSVVEMVSVVQNEASKLSYASMVSHTFEMKQGRSSPPTNTSYKNVRVVADDGLLSTPKIPRASSPVQALTSSSSGVFKAVTVSTNFAQGNVNDDFRCHGERANSPSHRGRFHNSGSESRSRPQNSDGHKGKRLPTPELQEEGH